MVHINAVTVNDIPMVTPAVNINTNEPAVSITSKTVPNLYAKKRKIEMLSIRAIKAMNLMVGKKMNEAIIPPTTKLMINMKT